MAVAAVALLSGCGGGGGSSSAESTEQSTAGESATTAGAGESSGVAEAEEIVAKYSTLPTSIGDMPKIGKPIEGGKTVAIINSGVPAAAANVPYLKAASEALGWKIVDIPAGTTASENSAAWDRVLQIKPDFVVNTSGFPTSTFAKQCPAMAEAGIPVFDNSVPQEEAFGYGNCVKGIVNNEKQIAETGKIDAAYIVADSEGKGNTVVLNVPELPILTSFTTGLEEEMTKLCPSCEVNVLELLLSDIGTQEIPTKAIGFLRSNSGTEYVAATFDGLLTSLPTALKGAGLEDVTLVGATPEVGNMVEIESGGFQSASVIYDQIQANWKLVDMMARYSVGQSVKVTEEAEDPFFIATSENVSTWPAPAEKFPWPTVADYESQYKALWGVE
jgi:ribose transport system substrate-binding protein